jgi:hypothetical protein
MPRLSGVFLALCALTACAPPLAIQVPVNRMDTPQTQGAHRVALDVGLKGNSRVEFIETVSRHEDDPPDEPTIRNIDTSVWAAGVDTRVGLAKRLDVALELTPSGLVESLANLNFSDLFRNLSGLVNFKFQPFGPTLTEDPDGRFSLAMTLGVGRGLASSNESTTHKRYHSSVASELYDAALIAGFHPSGSLQIFGGVFESRGTYDGEFSYRRDGVLKAEYQFDGSIRAEGWNVGLDVAKSSTVHFIVEFAQARVEVGTATETAKRLGLATTLLFR